MEERGNADRSRYWRGFWSLGKGTLLAKKKKKKEEEEEDSSNYSSWVLQKITLSHDSSFSDTKTATAVFSKIYVGVLKGTVSPSYLFMPILSLSLSLSLSL